MSDNYEPGTVAVATVRGIKGVRVVRGHKAWITTPAPRDGDKFPATYSAIYDNAREVTDVRPLVVLDLPNPKRAAAVLGAMLSETASVIADQIEAQTRPPKPPEPQGLGAVVECTPMCVNEGGDTTTILVRHDDGLWWSKGDGGWHWRDVRAVRVLSEGVTR